MPPSPVHKLDYATEALGLLTSRYSKARPGSLVTGTAALTLASWDAASSGDVFPKSISGLVAWFRADMGITLNGGAVSAWADQSGVGDANRNVSQATGTKQPTYNASDAAYNGRPTLSFNSVNGQILGSGTWSVQITTPFTLIAIGNTDGVNSQQIPCFGFVNGEVEVNFCDGIGHSVSLYNGIFLATPSIPTSAKMVALGVYGTSGAAYQSQKTAGITGSTGTQGFQDLWIGGVSPPAGGGGNVNGKIAEVIAYNRALTSGEIDSIMNYAGYRYGITIGP